MALAISLLIDGSPPPARGASDRLGLQKQSIGITPACAGSILKISSYHATFTNQKSMILLVSQRVDMLFHNQQGYGVFAETQSQNVLPVYLTYNYSLV